jgi:hypothetical protein
LFLKDIAIKAGLIKPIHASCSLGSLQAVDD